MVRFSCFQSRILSHKQKKAPRLPVEAMQKTLEDTSPNLHQRNLYPAPLKNTSCLKEDVEELCNITHVVLDSSPTEGDCRSEEINSKYSTDNDVDVPKSTQIKKSQSLGSGLNWNERNFDMCCSKSEMEPKFSFDGSSNGRVMAVSVGNDDHALSLQEQCQEHMHSDSAVNSDRAKNLSMFCIGDSRQSEKEGTDKEDLHFPHANITSVYVSQTPRAIIKSSSLPSMSSPNQQLTSVLHSCRSTGNLNDLDSEKTGMPICNTEKPVQNPEMDYFTVDNDKDGWENPAGDAYENCNYVDSGEDWLISVPEEENAANNKAKGPFHRWDEIPSKDLKLKRIQEWVIDLQHCDPLEEEEENNEFSLINNQEKLKNDILSGESTTSKSEEKVSPGMEAAKRYISDLNPLAAAAQLTNLGLVAIPFLSPFISLRALNLSGNSIERITSGALPRGLQILNLSKNHISMIEGLWDHTRLRVIDLSFNRLLRIGHGLASCSSLKELYLAGNKISEVEGLHRLLKLNILDLRFNKITTAKCLGQLAANHSCLQALSLEGNPAQKNVGDEQLKKYVQSILPNLIYYNRQSIKTGSTKDITADRSARLGHQIDRSLRAADLKNAWKGIVSQKTSSSSTHGRKYQVISSQKPSKTRLSRLPPTGVKTTQLLSLKSDLSMRRSRSEGTLNGP